MLTPLPLVQKAVTMAPVTMAPAGVKMAAPQKTQTVIAGGQVVAGGQTLVKPAVRPTLTPTAAAPAPPPPQVSGATWTHSVHNHINIEGD